MRKPPEGPFQTNAYVKFNISWRECGNRRWLLCVSKEKPNSPALRDSEMRKYAESSGIFWGSLNLGTCFWSVVEEKQGPHTHTHKYIDTHTFCEASPVLGELILHNSQSNVQYDRNSSKPRQFTIIPNPNKKIHMTRSFIGPNFDKKWPCTSPSGKGSLDFHVSCKGGTVSALCSPCVSLRHSS